MMYAEGGRQYLLVSGSRLEGKGDERMTGCSKGWGGGLCRRCGYVAQLGMLQIILHVKDIRQVILYLLVVTLKVLLGILMKATAW